MFVVFFTGKDLALNWTKIALFGNDYSRFFMSPSQDTTVGNVEVPANTLAVVLPKMTDARVAALEHVLRSHWLFPVDVQPDVLALLEKRSEVRMKDFLLSSRFVLPQQDQFHLVMLLCTHAGVNPNDLPGVLSLANATSAAKYALGYCVLAIQSAISALSPPPSQRVYQ
jgi:hypothetical protein